MFKKVLIANRGEIAVRVAKTLKQMGIKVVAVYSDPDRSALHVRAADEAYPLEGTSSVDTYLRGDKIAAIAKACGADAIHPGYGFLSENSAFAQACADARLTFIGPSPGVIDAMGDKLAAKRTVASAGVPIVPEFSWSGDIGAAELKKIEEIGYPVLIKAVAGGGGKGVRLVENERALSAAAESARREAKAAFGDDRIFIEKYLVKPRHIEFQIFGDHHGGMVHLFERECSVQRRYQKIVEESPSVALTPQLREKMGAAAVKAAKAAGYTNAGTVEFLLDASGGFYFLEVNTRLQVEHPVTEMITGEDLVSAQLKVASGEKLPFSQETLKQEGHAMECRIYAEDPSRGFLPSAGTIAWYAAPEAPGVRVDGGVESGTRVTPDYDPMLAKLIARGKSRSETLEKMEWALEHYPILGISTNIEFLQALIRDSEFVKGNIHTQFLQTHPIDVEKRAIPEDAWIAAALTAFAAASDTRGPVDARPTGEAGPWARGGSWRGI